MLIHMDPALLVRPEWNSLRAFLRRPFSVESCQRVEKELPQLAAAYRAVAGSRDIWAGSLPLSQIDDAAGVLMQAKAIGQRPLPLMPEGILKAQIVLLEEVLRDNAAWVRKHGGAAGDGASSAGSMPKLDVGASRLAVQAMALHEAAFLVLAGLFVVQNNGRTIEFSLTPRGLECLRNRVITTPMQEQTELALRQQLRSIISELRLRDRRGTSSVAALVGAAQIDYLEERFLDVFFSLGAHMRQDPEVAPLIRGARGLCRWIALLELVRLAGEGTLRPVRDLCERLHLDYALLEKVLTERSTALPSDQGIYRSASGVISLGATRLAHAIHCCKGAVLSDSQARTLGLKFEEQITAYVRKDVPPADYLVRPGFKRADNGAGKMYDCDVIIYDVRRRKIFFVQAKWKRDSRTANLDDELHDWGASNWPLTKGIDRLAVLRDRLAEPVVLDQIRAALGDIKLSVEHILKNAHFIVLHTLPAFNAYQIDGVTIYEWNLFRNLLLRGLVQRRWSPDGVPEHARPCPTYVHHAVLALEDPQQVLDHYCAAIGADFTQLPAAMRIRQEARYGFDLALPDASWWQRLRKRNRISILRPYI